MHQYFVCQGLDKPDALPLRLAHRDAHLARIRALHGEGRIKAAGPLLAKELGGEIRDALAAGFAGSLIIARFDSLAQAQSWWNDDPYVTHGIFQSWSVHPFFVAFD